MALADSILMYGIRADQPAASAANNGCYYRVTDEGDIVEQSNGSAWVGIGAEVNLTSGVSGILPVANGGTGVASGFAALISVPTTLTNAQIKALSTTGITLVAAPGAGVRFKMFGVSLSLDASAGAYTNINATYAELAVTYGTGTKWAAVALVNDASLTEPLTKVTDFLGAAHDAITEMPVPNQVIGQQWWVPQPAVEVVTDIFNKALMISLNNNGSGDLTGGNAANTMTVTVYYALEAI